MTKRILITGAAGFIGFHLARYLSERGDIVCGIDNFNSYYDPALKYTRAQQLQLEQIEIISGDIQDLLFLKNLIFQKNISHIVHLAAQAGVRYSTEQPQAYIQTNISGFLNILEICRAFPHLHLTYASSSSVYGLNTSIPFQVTDRTDTQASLYGVTKKCNELMAFSYYHLYQVRSTGLRFFTVYGPWGRPDMAYYRFTQALYAGTEICLYNYGDMQRDFTYISDIVEGIAAAIDKEDNYALYNLGNHQPEKLMTLLELLEEKTGKKSLKKPLPLQLGDVIRTYADISTATNSLGFQPKVSLSEGLDHFVQWYCSYHQVMLSK